MYAMRNIFKHRNFKKSWKKKIQLQPATFEIWDGKKCYDIVGIAWNKDHFQKTFKYLNEIVLCFFCIEVS